MTHLESLSRNSTENMSFVYQRPTLPQLQEVTENLRLEWDQEFLDEAQQLAGVIEEALKTVDVYKCPQGDSRDKGRVPLPEENENNQWVWKCHIEGNAGGKLTEKRIAIKDCISVAGLPMDAGNSALVGFTPREDAVVVRKILEEGATLVGKTSCENLCYSALSVTSCHGTVSNPVDRTRSSGGSSSGNGVALVRGEADIAVGTDSGCSVRVPASLCGCVGVKPTYGLVPTTGVVPCVPSLDHVGPMANNVQDCALLLEVLSDCTDFLMPACSVKRDYTSQLNGNLQGLKIGIIEQCLRQGPQFDKVTNMVLHMVDQLGSLEGVSVERVSIESYEEAIKIVDILSVLEYHNVVANSDIYKKQDRDGKAASVCATFYSDVISQSGLLQRTLNRMQAVIRDVESAFETFDVLVTPTTPELAPKLDLVDPLLRQGPKHKIQMNRNTCMFNVTGHPAISVTCGFAQPGDSSVSLPVGMQIVGGYYQEALILRVARTVERIRVDKK